MTSYALMEKLKETFWTEIKETKEKEKKNPTLAPYKYFQEDLNVLFSYFCIY